MSILINGMKMPKGRPVCIVIDAAGQARRYDLNNDRYADDKLFDAVSVMIKRSTVKNSPYTLGDSITAEDFMQRYGSGGSSTKEINCHGDACAVDLR